MSRPFRTPGPVRYLFLAAGVLAASAGRPAMAAPWRFVFFSDSHVTTNPAVLPEIVQAAIADEARLVLVSGDIANGGTGVTAAQLEAQLINWRDAVQPLYDHGIGVYALRGNRETDVVGFRDAWNAVFRDAYALPGNGPAGESNLTYAVAYSNALFIGLDEFATNQVHMVNQAWLDGQLADRRPPHVFVFGHEPAFRTSQSTCLGLHPDERNTFWSRLANAGVRLYLCGHDHYFNLARIDDGDADAANDVYQCVAGTSGASPMSSYNYNGTNAPYAPVNVFHEGGQYGYVLVEIGGPGPDDLDVTLTWKHRVYDTPTASYVYEATAATVSYTARAFDPDMDSVGDGIPDWWRRRHFGGDGTTTDDVSCAAADGDHDGVPNSDEYGADTDPTDPDSRLALVGATFADSPGAGIRITWTGGTGAWQFVESAPALATGVPAWDAICTNAPPTAVTGAVIRAGAGDPEDSFYRIRAHR